MDHLFQHGLLICKGASQILLLCCSAEGNTLEGSLPNFSPDSPMQVLRLQGVGLTGMYVLFAILLGSTADMCNPGGFPCILHSLTFISIILGTIPEGLGELKDLIVLNLAENALEGTIPSALGSGASLVSVKLNDNMLEGTVPIALGQGQHLKYVRLEKNALQQFDDAWFATGALESSSLVIFDVAKNDLKVSCAVATLYSL